MEKRQEIERKARVWGVNCVRDGATEHDRSLHGYKAKLMGLKELLKRRNSWRRLVSKRALRFRSGAASGTRRYSRATICAVTHSHGCA